MKNEKLRKLVFAAVLAAFVCVATMIIRIPTPTKGYVNLGDCIVLVSGWLLGPVYGGAAAGIGSMFADIISGYFTYAPATLIIKALMAVEGYFHTHDFKKYALRMLLFAVISEIPFDFMYGGTWFYPVHQNVIWTLLLGLLGINIMETTRKKRKKWAFILISVIVISFCSSIFFISSFLSAKISSSFCSISPAILEIASDTPFS